ncbi:MAG TPA: hypothetical protein GX016_08845 [Firmicutes bacterium]|nr:hypothetical protein [Bacillota bacterium]
MVGRTGAALHLPEPVTEPKTARRRRRRVTRRVESLTAYGLFVAVAVGLVLLYVAQYAYVAQLNLRLNRAEKQLAQIQIQNEQLEQQASELRSLRRVEEEAKTRLGMQKPETVRTVRAPLEPVVDTAVAAAEPASPPLEGGGPQNRLLAFLNWTRGLKRAFAHGVGENH